MSRWRVHCYCYLHATPNPDHVPDILQQARLAALYPGFTICHMPCSAVDPPADWWDEGEDAPAPLSPFVGNAVEAGQPCSWHTDFDPFHAPVGSPWEARFGRYGNRQARALPKHRLVAVRCGTVLHICRLRRRSVYRVSCMSWKLIRHCVAVKRTVLCRAAGQATLRVHAGVPERGLAARVRCGDAVSGPRNRHRRAGALAHVYFCNMP